MATEDRNEEVTTQGECTDCTSQERSFDALARGLATGTMSRGRALRLLGGALAGAAMSSVPGVAWARRKCKRVGRKCKKNRHCCSRNCIDNPSGPGRICGCRSGKTLCNGQCVANCTAPKVLDPNTCQCVCPSNPACAASGGTFNPSTCACVCPAGKVPNTSGDRCVECNNANDCPTQGLTQCQQATCTNGACGVGPKPNDTPCNDNNPCTTGDVCTAGVCAGSQIQNCVQCDTAADCATFGNPTQCQQRACTGGVCTIENKPDDTDCNDGNACTDDDVCTAGVCAGTLRPTCVECQDNTDCSGVPVDQCHRAVCGAQGFCVVENRANNTACDDGNPCTQNDVCTAGVCAGTEIEGCVLCSGNAQCSGVPVDQCHRAVCGAQGFCVVENKTDNTACDDNNPCTIGDTCQAGICTPGPLKDCDDNDPCTINTCDPETGQCVPTEIPNCCHNAGECPPSPDQCQQAACVNNVCGFENKDNDTACDDGNPCTVGDTCQAGVCTPGPLRDCDDNDICTTDTCDQSNGTCVHTEIPGCCRNAATDCPQPDNPCQQATCTSGVCGFEYRPNGAACSDNNSCTQNDQCVEGVCVGTRITGCVNCQSDGDCSTVAVTDCQVAFCQANNTCGVRNKNNGVACDDGNPCTVGDTCQAGVCVAGGPKNCNDNDICTTDSCDPSDGTCVHTEIPGCCTSATDCPASPDQCQQAACVNNVCGFENKDNGAACDDGNPCTVGDTCQAGVCTPGPLNTCNDNNICTFDSCDPVTGQCANTAIPGCCTSAATCPAPPPNTCQTAVCTNNTCSFVTTCTGQNNFCCVTGGRVGQCRRAPGAACNNDSQCCNSCTAGRCT